MVRRAIPLPQDNPHGAAVMWRCVGHKKGCSQRAAAYGDKRPRDWHLDPFGQSWCGHCWRAESGPVSYQCSWPGCKTTATGPIHEPPRGWEADSRGEWFCPVCSDKPRRKR